MSRLRNVFITHHICAGQIECTTPCMLFSDFVQYDVSTRRFIVQHMPQVIIMCVQM